MIRVRRDKLEDITNHNHSILDRINQQQSYYSSHNIHRIDKMKSRDKNSGDGLMGPIGEWSASNSFLLSARTKKSENECGL